MARSDATLADVLPYLRAGYGVEDIAVGFGLTYRDVADMARREPRLSGHRRIALRYAYEAARKAVSKPRKAAR
jgi:predicted transcriptional regulator